MANSKISALTAKTSFADTDEFVLVDNASTPATKKITGADLRGSVATLNAKTYITQQATATRVTGSAPDAIGEYRSYLRAAGARTYSETNGSPSTAPSSSNGYRLYTSAGFATGDSNNEPSRYEIYIGLNKEPVFEFYANTGRTGYISAYPFQRYGGFDVNGGFDVSYDPTTGIVQVFNPPYSGGNNFTGLTSAGDTVTADVYFDIKC